MSMRRAVSMVPVIAALACASTRLPAEAAADADLPAAKPGVLYAMGAVLGDQAKDYHLDESEARELARGVRDAALRKPSAAVRTEEMGALVNEFHETRLKELARREELAGASLLEEAAREPGTVKTETGMVMHVIDPGKGPKPTLFDYVSVNYHGMLRDGSVFYTNEGKPPERSQLGVNTRCWQEALGAVGAGGRIHVVCPPELTYGWGGWPGTVPGGAVLSYDLELVSIEPKAPPPNWQPDWDLTPQPPIGSQKK
jgi:FKBP-type peptidyl-prolyl cis-trans isomerase FkpA